MRLRRDTLTRVIGLANDAKKTADPKLAARLRRLIHEAYVVHYMLPEQEDRRPADGRGR
ncbi:MAG: hypothetical protein ACREIV_01100 [Planctomycetaceae bacterium]